MKETKCPRLLFAGGGSGSGKTLITCGIMSALRERGLHLGSLKCGPDFIDPMFHRTVIGSESGNLDSFFMDPATMMARLANMGERTDYVIMEGVMGYYDGVSGSLHGSSWEIGKLTQTPVILIFNGRGMGLSMIAQLKGLIDYQKPNTIQGIILNQVSEKTAHSMRERIEMECGVPVLGYVPFKKNSSLESRHLGLKMPAEIEHIQQDLMDFGQELEKTIQFDRMIQIGMKAEVLSWNPIAVKPLAHPLSLSVAKDEAFCFLYQENVDFLKQIGVTIHYFSPLHDRELPKDTQAILLPGGYPELYAKELEKNEQMRNEIANLIQQGIPVIAECGGYLYLGKQLVDSLGESYQMVGALPFTGRKLERLGKFGYVEVSADWPVTKTLLSSKAKAHEFHYYETFEDEMLVSGKYYQIQKADGSNQWSAGYPVGRGFGGFPHFYYYSNIELFQALFDSMTQKEENNKHD